MSVTGTLTKFLLEALHDKYFKKNKLSPHDHVHELYNKLKAINDAYKRHVWHLRTVVDYSIVNVSDNAAMLQKDRKELLKISRKSWKTWKIFEYHLQPLGLYLEREGFEQLMPHVRSLNTVWIGLGFQHASHDLADLIRHAESGNEVLFQEARNSLLDNCGKLEEITNQMEQTVQKLTEFSKRIDR